MEFSDIRVFVAVAEEGTATKAALKLAMTQPGISKHLARLESDVGGKLFDRKGKYLVLNNFGEMFLVRAKRILEDFEDIENLSLMTTCPIGNLNIGLTDAATIIITPPSLIKFRKSYPGVHVAVDVDSSDLIEAGVMNGSYDIGVVTKSLKKDSLINEDILYDDYIDALVSSSHPLAKRKRVTLENISTYPLIISPKRRRTRQLIDNVFESSGIRIKDVIDVYIHTAAVRFAEAGLGVALLPRAFIKTEISSHRCAHIKIIGDPIKRTLCMIRRNDKELSESAKYFYKLVLEEKKNVL